MLQTQLLIGLKTELSLLSKKAPINAPIKGPKTIPNGKIKIPTSRPIVVPLIAFFLRQIVLRHISEANSPV